MAPILETWRSLLPRERFRKCNPILEVVVMDELITGSSLKLLSLRAIWERLVNEEIATHLRSVEMKERNHNRRNITIAYQNAMHLLMEVTQPEL